MGNGKKNDTIQGRACGGDILNRVPGVSKCVSKSHAIHEGCQARGWDRTHLHPFRGNFGGGAGICMADGWVSALCDEGLL